MREPGKPTPGLLSARPRRALRARFGTGTDAGRWLPIFAACWLWLLAFGCSAKPDPQTLVMVIESSPTNLDPRVGLDAYSERIDSLVFDDLLGRDEHLNVQPQLAERWEIPDPRTYVFHLRKGVTFHDGRPLTSRDVKWTFDSLLEGKVPSTKAAAYRLVDSLETPDDWTVVFHLKEPFATLLWNLSDGAIGIVPYGSGHEISRVPIGSGPFRFVRAEQDEEVVLERNPNYWGEKPHLRAVRFAVVPDATTRALELRKGSADVTINALPIDLVLALEHQPNLEVLRGPGTVLSYLSLNLRDPILMDKRVRQAIAYAIDRAPMIHYLLHDFARPAYSLLPPESWAYDPAVPQYDHNPELARQMLEQAGYPARNGVRFHLTMKTSTDENTRLLAAVLQQQLREVGIVMEIRTFEFATFFADVTRGEYQVHSLRWVGGNEDPDIFEYVFHSAKFPPHGANRTFYSNPRVDQLIDQARSTIDQQVRQQLYAEIQLIVAQDVPSISLWYWDNVLVHSKRVKNLTLNPAGNYDFLRTAELAP
ncbi:MAG TPA: ABC transporter substrate-binding protein [Terriglobales bacterium]|nr:ABC transporter substrate-binding protein [Terriglobales bacterium]